MIKRFSEWLKETISVLSRPTPIVTNPSPMRVKAMLNNTEHKELRYVHNPNTGRTHVADASHYLHHNIGAQKEAEHGFSHFAASKGRNVDFDNYVTKSGHHAGYIHAHDLDHISTHGLHHFIATKQEPNLKKMGLKEEEVIAEAWQPGEYKREGKRSYSYNDHQELKKTLIPALRDRSSGVVHIGKRGKTHADIYDQHGIQPGWGDKHEPGYVHPATKTFHTRQWVGFDSTDLMTPHQLRKYENSY